jgi:hypothetical protein
MAIASGPEVELWHTPEKIGYATFRDGGRVVHLPIRSKSFRQWVARECYARTKKVPRGMSVEEVINVVEGKAVFDGRPHPIWVRVAGHDGKVYLDLADDVWSVVEVDADGWRVIQNPPVRFRRPKGLHPIPVPLLGGEVKDLRPFVNVTDLQWPLIVGWLAGAIHPEGPYPLLRLHGEQGSAKTTTGKLLRRLIDPNKSEVRSAPRGERDLLIAATNSWVPCFDNLSYIDGDLSDALCRLSTGGGFSTRTLYENDEETIFDARRPVILNGIEDVVLRPDLLDRTLGIEMPLIGPKKRLTEDEFWNGFEAVRPKVLGALLSVVSVALKNVPAVSPPTGGWPRMADFAKWVVAGGAAGDGFLQTYTDNRKEAALTALDGSPIMSPLNTVLEASKTKTVTGTATELLEILQNFGNIDPRRVKGWPGNPRALSAALKRLAPALRHAGMTVEHDERTKIWCIRAPGAPIAKPQNPQIWGFGPPGEKKGPPILGGKGGGTDG